MQRQCNVPHRASRCAVSKSAPLLLDWIDCASSRCVASGDASDSARPEKGNDTGEDSAASDNLNPQFLQLPVPEHNSPFDPEGKVLLVRVQNHVRPV